MSIFERIKELADKRKISLQKVATDLEFGENYIYNLKGAKSPAADKLALIADYFGVSVDYLLGKTEYKNFTDMKAAMLDEISKKGAMTLSEFGLNNSEQWIFTMKRNLHYLKEELTESKASFGDEPNRNGILVIMIDLILGIFKESDEEIMPLKLYADILYQLRIISDKDIELTKDDLASIIGKVSLKIGGLYEFRQNSKNLL